MMSAKDRQLSTDVQNWHDDLKFLFVSQRNGFDIIDLDIIDLQVNVVIQTLPNNFLVRNVFTFLTVDIATITWIKCVRIKHPRFLLFSGKEHVVAWHKVFLTERANARHFST